MLGKRAVCWSVLLSYGSEGVRVGGDGSHDLREGRVGVAAVVLPDCDGGVQVFEESEGGGVDIEDVASFPLCDSVVEELGCRGRDQIPWISALVHVFGVATDGDTLVLGNAGVNGVCDSKAVDQSLKVGEGLAVAGLEGGTVAVRVDVEYGDGAEDGVAVESGSAIVNVDVGDDVLAVPETLEEAKNFRCLVTSGASGAESASKLSAFNERTMLVLDSEEARSLNFFPQVESCRIPVLTDVGQVIGDNGPNDGLRFARLPILDQPVTVGDQSLELSAH